MVVVISIEGGEFPLPCTPQDSILSDSVSVPEPVEWAHSEIHLILKTLVSIQSDSLCHSDSKNGH